MKVLYSISIICLWINTSVLALPADVRAYIAQEMSQQRIPGLAVAVVRGGAVAHVAGFGLTDIENNTAVTPNSLFHSGSTGKMFTATAALLLADQKKLDLDRSVRNYLPELPEQFSNISTRHLLTMSSGLGEFYDETAKTGMDLRQDFSNEQLLQLISNAPHKFSPGESYLYSNAGYVLAGILIERIAGQPYYSFLKQQLFPALSMPTAREPDWSEIIPGRSRGYQLKGETLQNAEWVASSLLRTADGGLYFSANDVAQWLSALDRQEGLPANVLRNMTTPMKLADGRPAFNNYAMGWEVDSINEQPIIWHGGTWAGFRAVMLRYPTQQFSIAVLANLESAKVGEIARTVAGYFNPLLSPPKPVTDRNPGITQKDTEALRTLSSKELPSEQFSTTAQRNWPTYRVQQVLNEMGIDLNTATLRPTSHCSDAECSARDYRIDLGRYNMHWRLQRDKAARINAMSFNLE
jgi:CubicO group peptidase (beta-lactamase class C family)